MVSFQLFEEDALNQRLRDYLLFLRRLTNKPNSPPVEKILETPFQHTELVLRPHN
jgi:hypothetical protein